MFAFPDASNTAEPTSPAMPMTAPSAATMLHLHQLKGILKVEAKTESERKNACDNALCLIIACPFVALLSASVIEVNEIFIFVNLIQNLVVHEHLRI